MNTIFKIAAILLIPGGMVFGQSTSDTGYWGNQRRTQQQAQANSLKAKLEAQKMQQELKLTAPQFHSLVDINNDYQTKLSDFNKNSASYSDEQKQAKLKEINDEHTKKINAILNKEQIEQFKKVNSTQN